MSRSEFTRKTRQEALKRSEMLCEAVGIRYGLDAGKRCNAPLGYGVDFDHVIADSHGGDNSLDNCAAICKQCHKHKTAKYDTPVAAKLKRIEAKHNGTWVRSKAKIPSRPFPKRPTLMTQDDMEGRN